MSVLLAQILLPLFGALFVALVLLGLPGTWLAIAAAALCEWLTEPRLFGAWTFVVVVLLAGLGEAWELLASATRARAAGAGKRGALGALLGGIAGAIAGTFLLPVPLLGSLAGGGIGAFLGATLLERHGGRGLDHSIQIGSAAGVGHVLGQAGKLALGALVWLILVLAVWIP